MQPAYDRLLCCVVLCRRFYQELDFPWSMDPQLVLQLIPQVIDIVSQEVARVYADQIPAGVTPQVRYGMTLER
jgi:hypothetical protein